MARGRGRGQATSSARHQEAGGADEARGGASSLEEQGRGRRGGGGGGRTAGAGGGRGLFGNGRAGRGGRSQAATTTTRSTDNTWYYQEEHEEGRRGQAHRDGGQGGGRRGGRGGRGRHQGLPAADVDHDQILAAGGRGWQDQQQRKRSSFQIGDSCFTDISGGFRSGTIVHIPLLKRNNKFYRIKLDKDDENEDEEEEIVAEVGNIYDPRDTVPAIKKRGGGGAQAVLPWRTSRAKQYFQDRLRDENDRLHVKSDQEVFQTSFYDDGEPVLMTKYSLQSFMKNFKSLKAAAARSKGLTNADFEAFKREKQLYPRPALDFRGNPYYAGSRIRSSLIEDVKSGATKGKKPMEIIASRDEYKPFERDSKAFRNYLYRETRKESESVGWQLRRNKKGYKQHEADQNEARKNQSCV
jgi:hypothetical protein